VRLLSHPAPCPVRTAGPRRGAPNRARSFDNSDQFSDREKVALRYADAIPWDPSAADDAMWAELKRHFSEPELVELGYLIASSRVASGGSTRCGVQHGDVAAESTTGYRPKVVRPRP